MILGFLTPVTPQKRFGRFKPLIGSQRTADLSHAVIDQVCDVSGW